MDVIKIVAEIEISPSHRETLLAVLKTLVSGSRSEPGNKVYDLTEDTGRQGHFFVIEEWLSAEAIEKHNESTHFKAFVAAIEGKAEKLIITKVETLF